MMMMRRMTATITPMMIMNLRFCLQYFLFSLVAYNKVLTFQRSSNSVFCEHWAICWLGWNALLVQFPCNLFISVTDRHTYRGISTEVPADLKNRTILVKRKYIFRNISDLQCRSLISRYRFYILHRQRQKSREACMRIMFQMLSNEKFMLSR